LAKNRHFIKLHGFECKTPDLTNNADRFIVNLQLLIILSALDCFQPVRGTTISYPSCARQLIFGMGIAAVM
jgi:hypothetical protein